MTNADNEDGLNMPEGLREQEADAKNEPNSDQPVDFLRKHDLYPTEVADKPDQFVSITLNNEFQIRRITPPNDHSQYVEWPRSSRDEKNDQNTIWFEELELKNALGDIVKNRLSSDETGSELDIEVDRFHAYEEDHLQGFMDITINGIITINGAKLMETNGEQWIGWPSRKDGEEWFDLFSLDEDGEQRLLEVIQAELS